MHFEPKINKLKILAVSLVIALMSFMMPALALAAVGDACLTTDPPQAGLVCTNCGWGGCTWQTAPTSPTGGSSTAVGDTPLAKDINMFVVFLSALVGIAVVGSIIYGGIQYITAGDNPQAISAAKSRIVNSLIALVAFAFTFAFLQWLVPGGIFT